MKEKCKTEEKEMTGVKTKRLITARKKLSQAVIKTHKIEIAKNKAILKVLNKGR